MHEHYAMHSNSLCLLNWLSHLHLSLHWALLHLLRRRDSHPRLVTGPNDVVDGGAAGDVETSLHTESAEWQVRPHTGNFVVARAG